MKLLKKSDAEEFMSVTRKPKGGKKGGAAASSSAAHAAATTPAAASPAEPPKKRLNHGLDTLQTFMKFKIEVVRLALYAGSLLCVWEGWSRG